MYDSGIQKWSALFDLAIESGHIAKGATQGWYNVVDQETGELVEPKRRQKDLGSDDKFFEALVKNETFNNFIERKYKLTIPGKMKDDGNNDTI